MYIKIKNSSYFLNLMNNDIYAKVVFYKNENLDITNDKLIELKKEVKRAEKRYSVLYAILSLVVKFENESLTKCVALKLEKASKNVNLCFRNLEIFESKLAYILLKDILKVDKAKYLGFTEIYIKDLLSRFKKELENQYDEYYYNEKTGVVSQISEKGYLRPLPYIPTRVQNEIEKRERKQYVKMVDRPIFRV